MHYEPLISVIVPVRNGARFLASAMASIVAQGYGNLEVLLVDDGSTDGLAEHLKHCPEFVRYIRQAHQGQAVARNRGLQEAKGELIAFLDIDDLWTRCHLKRSLGCLQEHPQAGIAHGLMRQFWMASEGECYWTAPYRMPYLGSCLFRRTVFDECGLFDKGMAYGEDNDFFFRCWERDVVKVPVPYVSLLYRRHARNISQGHSGTAHLLVIRRRIERVRAGVSGPAVQRRYRFQDYFGDQKTLNELPLQEVGECDLLSA
jgi:glycosyltransferase involved in cell wall biosynthesis